MKGQSVLINAGLTGVSTPAEFCDGKYIQPELCTIYTQHQRS